MTITHEIGSGKYIAPDMCSTALLHKHTWTAEPVWHQLADLRSVLSCDPWLSGGRSVEEIAASWSWQQQCLRSNNLYT
jgi:hypothetical protein